jgi:WD40 repeat protein
MVRLIAVLAFCLLALGASPTHCLRTQGWRYQDLGRGKRASAAQHEGGQQLRRLFPGLHAIGEGYASICCVAISPDGKTAATSNFDNKIMLWDVASSASFGSLDHADWLQTVVFSPDGSMLASGSNDDTVKLWDMGGAEAAARSS